MTNLPAGHSFEHFPNVRGGLMMDYKGKSHSNIVSVLDETLKNLRAHLHGDSPKGRLIVH